VSDASVRSSESDAIAHIQAEGLLYPVTFIDGRPVYDGAVSYPAILRAVQNALSAAKTG